MMAETDPGWSPGTAADDDGDWLSAELAVLGVILRQNAALDHVSRILKPEHFRDELNGKVYALFLRLASEGRNVDPVTVLPALPPIEGMTGAGYLAHVIRSEGVPFNAADYARVIVERSLIRGLRTIATDVYETTRVPAGVDSSALLAATEERIADLRATHGMSSKGATLDIGGHIDAVEQELVSAHRGGGPVGWPWCLPDIEAVIDMRLEPGSAYGLLGASGDGKTSLILQQLRFGADQGVPGLFMSGEQTGVQCVRQMVSQSISLQARDLRSGKVSDAEYARFKDETDRIRRLPIGFERWSKLTVAQIGMRVRAFVRKFGPGVVAIDHAKIIVPENPKDILAQQVFQVYSDLKGLAGDTGCAVIVLMQRNSEFLKRRYMRPVKVDVYGGEGAIQPLDACFALFRPTKWLTERAAIEERDSEVARLRGEAEQARGLAELYGLKQRFGEDGNHRTVKDGNAIVFEGRFTRFVRPNRPAQVDMLDEPEGYA